MGVLKQLLLLMVMLSWMSQRMSAQQVKQQHGLRVEGVIQNEEGAPISGATIRLTTSGLSTVSDERGRFSVLVREGDTVVAASIGFKPMQLIYLAQPMLKLVLKQDQQLLDQVVVVGYGNERRSNITGSIATVDQKELEQSAALSFDQALVGKAAGVDILSSSGVPGAATAITIRGISTLNSDGNQPLVVIDGVPVYGTGQDLNTSTFNPSTTAMIGFGGTYVSDNLSERNEFENNPLSKINPADIESIEILKDAYATSIYGSRGAAGVILVTTKKGKQGKPTLQFRYVTGTSNPVNTPRLLTGEQYSEVYRDYYAALGQQVTFDNTTNTNWLDEVLRTAVQQQADLSVSGGVDKSQYFISGSYASQPSYIINSDYHRYTGRTNFSYDFSDQLQVGTNLSVSYTDNEALNAASIYRQAVLRAPNLPIYLGDGSFNYGKGTNTYGADDSNPLALALRNTNRLENNQTLVNAFFQYKPWEWLTLKSEVGTEYATGHAFTRRVERPSGFGDDAVESNTAYRKFVVNNTVNFLSERPEGHYINAVAGQSFEKSIEQVSSMGGYDFLSDDINSITAAESTYILRSLTSRWVLVSYFARLNYEYNRRYLAGVTYRLDGSSKFSQNRRFVGFPSFSVGWRLSEEALLQRFNWIDDFKVRASIGFAGNNSPTSYYGNQGQYTISSDLPSYAGTPILVMEQPDNPNLKWEKTRSVDVGADLTLWGGRLNLTVDYYERHIRDMIVNAAIPLYQGWSSQPQNIGDMKNSGIELTVNGQMIRREAWGWDVRFNMSRNTNKLLKLNRDGEEIGLADDAYKFLRVGQPVGLFYLYEWAGIDAYTGDPQWRYPDGTVSSVPPASRWATDDVDDFRKVYGSSMPLVVGGMGHNVRYKNWELDAFFSFSVGGKLINGTRAMLLTYTTEEAHNLSPEVLRHWTAAGDITDVPKLANASIRAGGGASSTVYDYTTSRTTSRFLENSSYCRLRSVNLSYALPPAWIGRALDGKLRSCRFFFRGSNLFTITGYSGVDPEVSAFGSSAIRSGYDELTLPQARTLALGIQLGL